MGKRGRKQWESFADGARTEIESARRKGFSVRSVATYLRSARQKLAKHPEALADLIETSKFRGCEPRSFPACGSVECLPPWRQPESMAIDD